MKIKLLAILLLPIAFTACQTKQSNTGDDVKSITIKNTELGRQTLFPITCESFDKYFPKPNVVNVISKPGIDTLMKALTGMKQVDNDSQPDVRGKVFITHTDNKVDTVCLGVTYLKYKNLTYETPQKLLLIIQQ